MSRFKRPPTPEEWASAAAECLRENYPDAGVLVQAGPSGATRIKVRTDSPHLAYIDAWPSLKVAASGPQAQRDAALEVLAGAGFVDGWSPGATGRMRATMPAELEDAGAKPPDRPADRGGDALQSALRTLRNMPRSPRTVPRDPVVDIAHAIRRLALDLGSDLAVWRGVDRGEGLDPEASNPDAPLERAIAAALGRTPEEETT